MQQRLRENGHPSTNISVIFVKYLREARGEYRVASVLSSQRVYRSYYICTTIRARDYFVSSHRESVKINRLFCSEVALRSPRVMALSGHRRVVVNPARREIKFSRIAFSLLPSEAKLRTFGAEGGEILDDREERGADHARKAILNAAMRDNGEKVGTHW